MKTLLKSLLLLLLIYCSYRGFELMSESTDLHKKYVKTEAKTTMHFLKAEREKREIIEYAIKNAHPDIKRKYNEAVGDFEQADSDRRKLERENFKKNLMLGHSMIYFFVSAVFSLMIFTINKF